MKKHFYKITLAVLMSVGMLNIHAQNPESTIPADFAFTYKYETINGLKLAYYEQGTGDPILFLHGIPENSFIWRNIVPKVSEQGRAIALDLAGMGKSDIIPETDYSIQSQYEYLRGFIEKLQLKNITLVVTDVGSMLGLKYANENRNNIKRIVFMEAMFMPSRAWYKQLKFKHKVMFAMMRKQNFAKKMIVEKNKMPKLLLKMAVVKKPAEEVANAYAEPFNDKSRRNILLYGMGPHTMQKKGISKKAGDFADELNKYAAGLVSMSEKTPFLIIHATPGMIVSKKALNYAKTNFKNVTFLNIGKGKHYLTEDHPTAIAEGIASWINTNK